MAEVTLHVYDVSSGVTSHEAVSIAITQVNSLLKQAASLGGIFHTAVQVYGDVEWAYQSTKRGSGVFSCPAKKNPAHTYRETIAVGRTKCSAAKVSQILKELTKEWDGKKYDLLAKNCNHFSDAFLERLGVPKLPAWVNRFAQAGDAAMEIKEKLVIAKRDLVFKGKDALRFIQDASTNPTGNPCCLCYYTRVERIKDLIFCRGFGACLASNPLCLCYYTKPAPKVQRHRTKQIGLVCCSDPATEEAGSRRIDHDDRGEEREKGEPDGEAEKNKCEGEGVKA